MENVMTRPIACGALAAVLALHIHWYKVRNGKIVEHTANRDDIGMMRQLGLLPPAPPSN
jgi:hypothetical protein